MVPIFYSPAYVGTGHAFDTTRKSQWIAEALHRQAAERMELRDPGLLAEEVIARVHSAEYVTAVRTGQPRLLAESQGFPWDLGVWTMAQAVNAGLVHAALAALECGVAGSLSSGIHHARRGEGDLFCTFNGLVLAAKAALDAGADRVLILDTDAHCGGGTFSLIRDNERIWQRDLAVNFMDRYEDGGRTVLSLVNSADDYLPALDRHLLSVADLPIDLCLYYAGMDPHEDCTTGGLARVDTQMLRDRERLVFDWARSRSIPIAFGIGGGYVSRRLERTQLVELHLLTVEAACDAVSS